MPWARGRRLQRGDACDAVRERLRSSLAPDEQNRSGKVQRPALGTGERERERAQNAHVNPAANTVQAPRAPARPGLSVRSVLSEALLRGAR